MKIAVITPYFDVPLQWLHECHLSVKAQTSPCTHFIVSDGQPYDDVDSWDAQHIKLPVNIADYGDTPRGVGSVAAIGQGFDAIAYLDADNWYYPEHLESMLKLHKKTGAAVVTSARNLHRLDGSLLGKCTEADGKRFVDTNCYFFTRSAFFIIQVWWSMLPQHHCIDDQVIWAHIRRNSLSHAHRMIPTVAYRTSFASHYRQFGENPPKGSKSGKEINDVLLEITEKQKQQQGPLNVHIKR